MTKPMLAWGLVFLAALAASLAIRAGGMAGSAGPAVLEAQRFVLKDADGKVRAELSTARDNEPKLWLFDADGRRRLEVSMLNNGSAGVWLFDDRERIRAGMSFVEGEPALHLRDKEGRDRAKLTLVMGEPSLFLWGQDGQALWSAPGISRR